MRRKATPKELKNTHLFNIAMFGIIQFAIGFATAFMLHRQVWLSIVFLVIGVVYFVLYMDTFLLDLAEIKEARP